MKQNQTANLLHKNSKPFFVENPSNKKSTKIDINRNNSNSNINNNDNRKTNLITQMAIIKIK